MNELLRIETRPLSGEAVQTVDGRELHAFLEVGKDFSSWIKDRINAYGFGDGADFLSFEAAPQNGGAGNRGARIEYALSLDMAKELAMVERNAKGKEARAYFIECERRAKTVPAFDPNSLTRMDLIKIAHDAESERLVAVAQLQAQAPIVEGFERIAGSEGSLCLRDAAKTLQVQPMKLIRWLQEIRWIYRRAGNAPLLGYQDKIQDGYLAVKLSTHVNSAGEDRLSEQVRVTGKGVTKLAKLISASGVDLNAPRSNRVINAQAKARAQAKAA